MLIRSGRASREDEQTNTSTAWPVITGHAARPRHPRASSAQAGPPGQTTFYQALNEK